MIKKTAAFIFAAVFLFALPYFVSLRPLIVLSGSMEPAIHTGSLIFININRRDPLPGDIITASLSMGESPAVLVTHRIVREEEGLFVTRGDANGTDDHVRINREQIVGTYIFQIPHAGYLIAFLRSHLQKVISLTGRSG